MCITESLCCTRKLTQHCKSTILQFLKRKEVLQPGFDLVSIPIQTPHQLPPQLMLIIPHSLNAIRDGNSLLKMMPGMLWGEQVWILTKISLSVSSPPRRHKKLIFSPFLKMGLLKVLFSLSPLSSQICHQPLKWQSWETLHLTLPQGGPITHVAQLTSMFQMGSDDSRTWLPGGPPGSLLPFQEAKERGNAFFSHCLLTTFFDCIPKGGVWEQMSASSVPAGLVTEPPLPLADFVIPAFELSPCPSLTTLSPLVFTYLAAPCLSCSQTASSLLHVGSFSFGTRDLLLFPGQGSNPGPLQVEAWSLNHWTTREVTP